LLVKAGKLKKQSVVSRESKFETIRTYLVQKQLEQIDIDEIDHVFMEDFKFYLKISKYQDSTIEKYLFLIKGVTKYAVSKGYTQDRKIESYKVEKAKEKILYHLHRKSWIKLRIWICLTSIERPLIFIVFVLKLH
jgi:site-specific recombinase XerD